MEVWIRRTVYSKFNYINSECPNWNKFQNVLNYKDGGCDNMYSC